MKNVITYLQNPALFL